MPKRISSLLATLALSLLDPCVSQEDGSIASPPDGSTCWGNTTLIYQHLVEAPPFSSNTYILCPDTVFTIGFTDSQGGCCDDGDLPLMARTNTKYQCGEDGSSANNCLISGGTSQVLVNELVFAESEATSVVMQGLTFSDASMTASMPNQPGDVTFVDCIFMDAQNSGTIVSLYEPVAGGTTNRRLDAIKQELASAPIERRIGYLMSEQYLADALADADEARERRLQRGPQEQRQLQDQQVCRLYFNQTVFRNNTQGATQGATTYGVITARASGSFLSFDSCRFEDNNFGVREVSQLGYAIESWGSPIEIVNTCFTDNNFIGWGTVNVWDGAAYRSERNYGSADTELFCNFMAVSEVRPEDELEVTCVDYELTSCQGTELAPTTAETPTAGPPTAEESTGSNVASMRLALFMAGCLVISLLVMV